MLISPEQEALIGRVFESYLTEHHHGDIVQLIGNTDEETHRAVVVNAMTLFEANMEVGDYFNAYPEDVLAIFDKVLHRKATELSDHASSKHDGGQRSKEQRMRRTLHARITGLPVCPELTRDTIPRSRDVGHFLSVTGTVIRTSVAKVLEYERDYMCTKCRHVFTVHADFDQFYTFVPPAACPLPDGCNSFRFTCLSGGSEPAACRDYQEIKIQEQVQRLSVGSIPRSLVVVLQDDLVDSCKSGDDVTVYGVMCLRWKPLYDGARCDVELVLKANNIEVNNQQAAAALLLKDIQKEFEDFWRSYKHDPIAGRNQILLSLCPQVFGMYVVKLAVAMVLAGGVQRTDSCGTKIRGECHMLLVGDPGTGKSQFLKYAAKIMARSVLTAGIGSTSAGLTVAAVKDGGDWHLEAGALVLSDGGLCCIDEFNSIKEHDRISIHEAMEQQSISVAKAGMVCKLNTRTTILAATNPKGGYNSNEPLSVNVALASPLLSRFDLVLVLLDTRNAEWDRIISSFILEDRGPPAESSGLWAMEKMRAYFSVIKGLQPQMSEEANCILTRYYQLQRQSDGRNAARTTIRMLESLSRLAEAHARLMYRESVNIEDAVVAVSVMECSMQGGALLGDVNALLTSFPAEPDQQYQSQCQILLEGLNLPLLLQKETDRLTRLKSSSSEVSQFSPPIGSDSRTRNHDTTAHLKTASEWNNTSLLSPDGLPSPIITSTQENPNRKPNSCWSKTSAVTKQPRRQTEDDTGSELNHRVSADPMETISSASEGRGENIKETVCVQREETLPESLGDDGLTHRQRAEEMQPEPADRMLSGGGARTEGPVSGEHTSSTLSLEDKRNLTRIKSISTALREKAAAEAGTCTDLHAKLSGFMFKPKRMRPSVHDQHTVTTSETLIRTNPQEPFSHDDSARPPTNTRDTKGNQHVSDGRGGEEGLITEVGESARDARTRLTSQKQESVSSCGKDKVMQGKSVERKKGSDFTDILSRQRTTDSTGDGTRNPSPFRSDHIRTIVASSAVAKLSRFSFSCTTKPTATAPTNMESSPHEGDDTECSGAPSGSPRHSPLGKRRRTGVQPYSRGQEHESPTPTLSTFRAKQTEQSVKTDEDQSSVSVRKRKCFEVGFLPRTGAASGALFSGASLFASADFSNDVLDTDWDQEVSKEAKV